MTKKKNKQEALEKQVNMSGQGEDPAVQALLSDDFVEGSNVEASQIAMAINRILHGMEMQQAQMNKVVERMDKMDEDALRREEANKKYIEEVLDKAEKLKLTGEEKDKVQAKGIALAQNAIKVAKAEAVQMRLEFEERLKNEPKETVKSFGEPIYVMEHGQQTMKIVPEVVRIKHKKWVLPINQEIEVPKSVADYLRVKKERLDRDAKLKGLLQGDLEAGELAQKWNEIQHPNDADEAMPTIVK